MPMRVSWFGWVLVLGFALGVGTPAVARADDTAAAQALFDQGKALMAEKKFAEACPKLEESQRLDPGMGTLFQLAVCYEGIGKTASAWAKFKDVAAQARAAGQPDRAGHAEQRAAALEPRLVRLVIEVPETSRVSGLKVRRADTEVGQAVWGAPVPVDPGELRISASAPGHAEWSTVLRISDSDPVTRVSVPRLESKPEASTPAPAPRPALPPAAEPRRTPPREARTGSGPLPWTALGVGVAGLLVGAVGGFVALDQKSSLESSCPGGKCPPEAHDDHATYNRWRTVSTVGFVVGAVGVGTGVVLLLTSSSKPERVEARLGPSGATVGGRF